MFFTFVQFLTHLGIWIVPENRSKTCREDSGVGGCRSNQRKRNETPFGILRAERTVPWQNKTLPFQLPFLSQEVCDKEQNVQSIYQETFLKD